MRGSGVEDLVRPTMPLTDCVRLAKAFRFNDTPAWPRPMKTALAASAVLLVLLAVPAGAQDIDGSYQIRAALGDIPTTDAVEPDGTWNVVQRLRVAHDGGNATTATFFVPAGAQFGGAACDCQHTVSESGDAVEVTVAANETAGDKWVDVTSRQDVGTAWALSVRLSPDASAMDAGVVLYAPPDHAVAGAVEAGSPGLSTDGSARIHFAEGSPQDPLPDPLWFTVAPATGGTEAPPARDGAAFPFLALAVGLIAGAAVWGLLVRQGVVQKRTRKQVVGASAHSELASRETKETLEGRKRALVAALRELEVAKMNKEIDSAAYDALKADFKKQTVTVMRALENAREADAS